MSHKHFKVGRNLNVRGSRENVELKGLFSIFIIELNVLEGCSHFILFIKDPFRVYEDKHKYNVINPVCLWGSMLLLPPTSLYMNIQISFMSRDVSSSCEVPLMMKMRPDETWIGSQLILMSQIHKNTSFIM